MYQICVLFWSMWQEQVYLIPSFNVYNFSHINFTSVNFSNIVLKFTKKLLLFFKYRIMYPQIQPLLSQICELRNIQGIEALQESMNNMS